MNAISDPALSALLDRMANDNTFSDYTRAGLNRAGALLVSMRAERVQLQGENESLRADLRTAAIDFGMWLTTRPTVIEVGAPVSVYAMTEALQEYEQMRGGSGKTEDPTARDKTDIEVLAERLAKVEDRLANSASAYARNFADIRDSVGDIARDVVAQHENIERVENRVLKVAEHVNSRIDGVVDIIGQRIAELVEKTGGTIPGYDPDRRFDEIATVLKAHEECLIENLGYPKHRAPEQRDPGAKRDTFERGDEVRVDMALTQGGRRIFGWYMVEAIRTNISGYTVQVSAPEKPDPKPLFWIKPEDVLEVRKAAR